MDNNIKFKVGVYLGEGYCEEEDDEDTAKLIENDLKKDFPNILLDFDWESPYQDISYDFEILEVEGDSHKVALELKAKVMETIGWIMGEYH